MPDLLALIMSVYKPNYLYSITLVGPPRDNPEPEPLAVLHLDHQLCVGDFSSNNKENVALKILRINKREVKRYEIKASVYLLKIMHTNFKLTPNVAFPLEPDFLFPSVFCGHI